MLPVWNGSTTYITHMDEILSYSLVSYSTNKVNKGIFKDWYELHFDHFITFSEMVRWSRGMILA